MNKQQVIELYEKHLPRLEEAFVGFKWENEAHYAQYLAQTFRYITHSTKLLEFACDKSTNPELQKCLIHHVEEENGHEKMAWADLKRMGYTMEQFPELETTKEVYGSIYRGIETQGPAPIIGYALALEGVSARRCPEIAKRLIATYGPLKSTLIKLHGDVDTAHMQESFHVLDLLNEKELDIVADVMLQSIERYIQYLNEVSTAATKWQNAQVDTGANW